MWGWTCRLVHAKVPYSEDAPIAELYPTTCKSLDNITKHSSIFYKILKNWTFLITIENTLL